jgi:hypothetical protein
MHIDPQTKSLLLEVYADNDCPCDRIVKDDTLARGFRDEFVRRGGLDLSPTQIKDHLLYLRKSKEKTGGLPPIGRSFSGPRFIASDDSNPN